jgi:hypothetical protein
VSRALSAAALAGALAVAALVSFTPALASPYVNALAAVARALDHAANTRTPVPVLHVPPAPLSGPPRYSPSLDDWLQSALSKARLERKPNDRANDLRAVASTLRYLAAGASPSLRTRPRGDVAAAAAQILAEPAYRAARTGPAPATQKTIWEKILDWIVEQFVRLFSGLAQAAAGVPLLGSVFAIVLIALAVLGLAYVAYRIADGLALRRKTISADGELLPPIATADELHAAAIDAARAGAYARAIALLFHASLLQLDRTNRVEYDPARTPGEYRRLVRAKAPPAAGDFDALARVFTLAAFADVPVVESDWMSATSSYRGLFPSVAAR